MAVTTWPEQQVLDMVKGAIEWHLTPLVEQLSPLVTQLQTQRESGGGESNTFLPFGDDELLPSAPLQKVYANYAASRTDVTVGG